MQSGGGLPPGAPHTFANPGDRPAVMLSTFTPDLYLQYFRELRDGLGDGRRTLTPQAAIDTMSRYATGAASRPHPRVNSPEGEFTGISVYSSFR